MHCLRAVGRAGVSPRGWVPAGWWRPVPVRYLYAGAHRPHGAQPRRARLRAPRMAHSVKISSCGWAAHADQRNPWTASVSPSTGCDPAAGGHTGEERGFLRPHWPAVVCPWLQQTPKVAAHRHHVRYPAALPPSSSTHVWASSCRVHGAKNPPLQFAVDGSQCTWLSIGG